MINQKHLILISFCKRENTGGDGIILGANIAGDCFLLTDLTPINFFN